MYKSPSHMPNFGLFYEKDTNPGPQKDSPFNKSSIILWDPAQSDFGPVYHVRVNFQDLPTKYECPGRRCPHCKATRLYTKYLRTLEEERS
jgi:hypothetical protein